MWGAGPGATGHAGTYAHLLNLVLKRQVDVQVKSHSTQEPPMASPHSSTTHAAHAYASSLFAAAAVEPFAKATVGEEVVAAILPAGVVLVEPRRAREARGTACLCIEPRR